MLVICVSNPMLVYISLVQLLCIPQWLAVNWIFRNSTYKQTAIIVSKFFVLIVHVIDHKVKYMYPHCNNNNNRLHVQGTCTGHMY